MNPGKGDKPRNCFNIKYRNNYDVIDWGVDLKKINNHNSKTNTKNHERKNKRNTGG